MAWDDDDDLEVSAGARALERSGSLVNRKLEQKKQVKEKKSLSRLMLSVLKNMVHGNGQKDAETKRQSKAFKTETREQKQKQSILTSDIKANPDVIIQMNDQEEQAAQEAQYEEERKGEG